MERKARKMIFKEGVFKDKVIVLSGGTSKMILQAAFDFASLGAKIALLARRVKELGEAASSINSIYPDSTRYYKLDVRDSALIAEVITKVINDFGKIDVLINGAAGNFLVEAEKLSANGFKSVIEIDALGTFLLSKEVFNQWMGKNGGNIINISATLHHHGTLLQVHSSAAKAAVDAITKTLSLEWGPKGVRVNGIAPGLIEGTEGADRLSSIDKANSKENLKTKTNDINKLSKFIPLQRFGTIQDISDAILFLSSDASSYITGTVLQVDGGQIAIIPNWLIFEEKFLNKWSAKF